MKFSLISELGSQNDAVPTGFQLSNNIVVNRICLNFTAPPPEEKYSGTKCDHQRNHYNMLSPEKLLVEFWIAIISADSFTLQ